MYRKISESNVKRLFSRFLVKITFWIENIRSKCEEIIRPTVVIF